VIPRARAGLGLLPLDGDAHRRRLGWKL